MEGALVTALIGFLVSILASVVALTTFVGESESWKEGRIDPPEWVETLAGC